MRSTKTISLLIGILPFCVSCSSTPVDNLPTKELDGTLNGTTLAYPIDLSFDTPTDKNGCPIWQYYKDESGDVTYRVDLSMYYKRGYTPDFYNDRTICFTIVATYKGYEADGSDYVGDICIETIPSHYTEVDLIPERQAYECLILRNNDLEYKSEGYEYDVRFSLLFPKLGRYHGAIAFFQHSTCKTYASQPFEIILEEPVNSSSNGNISFRILK